MNIDGYRLPQGASEAGNTNGHDQAAQSLVSGMRGETDWKFGLAVGHMTLALEGISLDSYSSA